MKPTRRSVPLRAAFALAVAAVCGACGAATKGAGSTTSSTSSTPSTTAAAPAVTVLPVVSCPTTNAGGSAANPYVPRRLPAAGAGSGLSFYSNGLLTVLAPSGWTCNALVAGDGSQVLDTQPPGQPDYSTHGAPPGAQVVQLAVDYTGHGPGSLLVCPLFPGSPAVTFLQGAPPCPTVPTAELRRSLTDDVVSFADPPSVKGTGAGSGGSLESTGDAVYPQLGAARASVSVTVSVLSCTLPTQTARLCQAIEADFLVRRAPGYTGNGG